MGALANATALRHDQVFRDWVETAIVYQSRLVLTGDSAAPAGTTNAERDLRFLLARSSAVQPGAILEMCVTAIAANPAIASRGATAAAVGEQPVIDEIASLWTALAKISAQVG